MTIDAEELRLAADVAWTVAGERVVLVRLSSRGAEPLILEDTASQIWLAIADGLGLDELIDDLSTAFDIDRATVAADVAGFVDDAITAGILEHG